VDEQSSPELAALHTTAPMPNGSTARSVETGAADDSGFARKQPVGSDLETADTPNVRVRDSDPHNLPPDSDVGETAVEFPQPLQRYLRRSADYLARHFDIDRNRITARIDHWLPELRPLASNKEAADQESRELAAEILWMLLERFGPERTYGVC
jgi:hypothetical protein